MTVTWNVSPAEVWPDITQRQVNAIEREIIALVRSLLDPAQSWMRANHRWQNRTGNAEAGLYTDIETVAHETVIMLFSHGPSIDYAVFLEYAHSGRFAILGDAVDQWAPEFYRGVQDIVRRYST